MDAKNGSLLTKFTSFFRDGGGSTDAEDSEVDEDSRLDAKKNKDPDRQSRRRQDDAIRSREFTQLRTLIQQRRQATTGGSTPDIPRLSSSVSPSTFNRITQAPTDSIIEAADPQASQWWGTPSDAPSPTSPSTGNASSEIDLSDLSFDSTPTPDDELDLDFTAALSAQSPAAPPRLTTQIPPSPSPSPSDSKRPTAPEGASIARRRPELPASELPALDLPDSDLPNFELPNFELPDFDPPTLQPPVLRAAASQASADLPAALTLVDLAEVWSATTPTLAPTPTPILAATATPTASLAAAAPVDNAESRLKEAALSYAAGDFSAAEDHLLGALEAPDLDPETVEMLNFALFDIYRATGQKDHFEAAALDYAERTGRSPAEWFSLPELLQAQSQPRVPQSAPVKSPATHWKCPATLDTAALLELQAPTGATERLPTMDWNGLRAISTGAGPALAQLIRQWSRTPVVLTWSGADALVDALTKRTQLASRREEELWWRIHMDLLCILRRNDDFENLALDYCVAFEVSPPAWEDAKCTLGESKPNATPAPTVVATSGASASKDPHRTTLSGEIMGANHAELAALQSITVQGPFFTVSCALLRRIDTEAAQALVQWARSARTRGLQISFTQVPRLVLVLFLMSDLEQYASLATRPS